MSRGRSSLRPPVLVLAAGNSLRFGSDKRRSLLGDGETLLRRSLECYRQAGLQVVLCLSDRREDDDLAREFAATDVDCMRCARAAAGMGATLAEGALRCGGAPGVFVALADMPIVEPTTLQRLECALARDRIVYPVYRGERGHPVLFGADFLCELQRLDGDRGASLLLRRYAGRCREIAVDDPGVILDADTPEALAALVPLLQLRSSGGVSGCDDG